MKALGINFKRDFFLMGVLIWSNSADLKHQPWPTLHVQQPLLCQQLPPMADCIFQDGHNRISQPTYAVMLTLLPMRGGGLCSFPLNLGGHVTDRGDATGLLRLDHKRQYSFHLVLLRHLFLGPSSHYREGQVTWKRSFVGGMADSTSWSPSNRLYQQSDVKKAFRITLDPVSVCLQNHMREPK